MSNNINNTALLVMDMQSMMLGMIPDAENLVNRIKQAIAHARANNMPVVYIVVGFRAGTPEISPNNKGFMAAKSMVEGIAPEAFMAIHPELAPQEHECVVVKRRVSAFTGSDLEVVLRAKGIQHIVLTGIATGGVVLSTLREAADKDFQITVLTDGCGDREEEVHQFLLEKIFPRQADMLTVEAWTA